MRVSTLPIHVKMRAPAIVMAALPRPPNRLLPPMTTAVTAVKAKGWPERGSPVPIRAEKSRPARAAAIPHRT